jgi:hypothetical protein
VPRRCGIPSARRIGGIVAAGGLLGLILAHLAAPARLTPLLDGVVVEEPYRYLQPIGGQAGDPGSADQIETVQGGVSPGLAAATSEAPPQAQLLAAPGAFDVGDARTMRVTIEAVTSGQLMPGRTLAGNVYRFSMVDENGGVIRVLPAASVTVVLRAPAGTARPVIVQRTAEGWAELPTSYTGLSDLYLSSAVAQLGDLALVTVPSSIGGAGNGWPTWVPLALALALAVIVGGVALRESARSRPPSGRARH